MRKNILKFRVCKRYEPRIIDYNFGTIGYWLFYQGSKEKWFSSMSKESQEQLDKLLKYHKFKIK